MKKPTPRITKKTDFIFWARYPNTKIIRVNFEPLVQAYLLNNPQASENFVIGHFHAFPKHWRQWAFFDNSAKDYIASDNVDVFQGQMHFLSIDDSQIPSNVLIFPNSYVHKSSTGFVTIRNHYR
ncbi:MAG: hypothetical protein ACOC1X_02955 [Promethearchaeota archaeon]